MLVFSTKGKYREEGDSFSEYSVGNDLFRVVFNHGEHREITI